MQRLSRLPNFPLPDYDRAHPAVRRLLANQTLEICNNIESAIDYTLTLISSCPNKITFKESIAKHKKFDLQRATQNEKFVKDQKQNGAEKKAGSHPLLTAEVQLLCAQDYLYDVLQSAIEGLNLFSNALREIDKPEHKKQINILNYTLVYLSERIAKNPQPNEKIFGLDLSGPGCEQYAVMMEECRTKLQKLQFEKLNAQMFSSESNHEEFEKIDRQFEFELNIFNIKYMHYLVSNVVKKVRYVASEIRIDAVDNIPHLVRFEYKRDELKKESRYSVRGGPTLYAAPKAEAAKVETSVVEDSRKRKAPLPKRLQS